MLIPGDDGIHFPVVVGQIPVFLLVGHQGPLLAPRGHPQPWCMGLSWQLTSPRLAGQGHSRRLGRVFLAYIN